MKIQRRLYLILTLVNLIFISLFCDTIPEPPSNFTEANAGTELNPYKILLIIT